MSKIKINASCCLYIQRSDEELELDISASGYYDPGRLSGPPENCYPPEGDLEIISIELDGKKWDGQLTGDEYNKVIEKLWENSSDEKDYYDDDSDYDDDMYLYP